MAVPRNLLHGRCLFARSWTAQHATGSTVRILTTSKATRQFSLSVRELAQNHVTGPDVPPTWTQSLPAPRNEHSIRISKLRRDTAPADIEKALGGAGLQMYVAFLRDRDESAVWSRDINMDTESGWSFPLIAFIFRPKDPHSSN